MLLQQLSGNFEESGPWLACSLQIQPNLITHGGRSGAIRGRFIGRLVLGPVFQSPKATNVTIYLAWEAQISVSLKRFPCNRVKGEEKNL